MAFTYLTNIDLDCARTEYASVLQHNGFGGESEILPVAQCCGRITARAVYARICSPHYHASAMDGIAVHARDTFGATETTPIHLKKDQYIVVDTGDPLPENCDAVIMVEDIVEEEAGVCIYGAAAPWQNIRQIGEDICAGEMILTAYQKISPSAIGALIAGGILTLEVIKKPVVGIIPTGDEIVPPTDHPAPGDILEFNSAIFSSMIRQWNAETITYPIVPDRLEEIRSAVTLALQECDMVILNAGSSAGRDDYSCQIIRELGSVLYHGIAIKPGKPAILGYQQRKPILGVPGYPVSGIIVVEQILKPLLDVWYHQPEAESIYVTATLSRAVISSLKYREFIRVRLGCVDEKLIASPLKNGSGVISSFMKADGILEIPQGVEGYETGSTVSVRLLRPRSELQNTLVAIGSHDPLLDELADMIHSDAPEVYMSSSHVGSMGGIMATRRGENHIAGIHLLNEEDGRYNEAFLRKYFPKGGVRLVECVGRSQGLMVAKGNPLGIQSIADIARRDIRYVNRQKGSGTRILLDYLCKQNELDVKTIYGYDREEFTHTSVAAQIQSGSADAGLGIYSAAEMYGLEFIPVTVEQYDLLIPDAAWDTPFVRQLLKTMGSPEFRRRLEQLGGYTIDQPGRVRLAL